jgi:hypothetical protein
MNPKLLRSTLCLLAMSALFTNGAIAQPSAAPSCVTGIEKNSDTSLISVRLSEQGSVLVAVKSNTKGDVTECRILKSGGSERIDRASCAWVQNHWSSLERCQP